MRKFQLGKCVLTPGAISVLASGVNPYLLLARHVTGDWGDVSAEDRQANDRALIDGTRLLSAYVISGHPIWVITEADRSVTTILLPSEY